MIEAPEIITTTQRKLHDQHRVRHKKFFPNPPPVKSPQVDAPAIAIHAAEADPEKSHSPKQLITSGPPVGMDQTHLRLKIIKQVICAEFNISQLGLITRRRTAEFVMPRHMFSYLASRLTKASLPHLAKSLGGQDHTTIMHAIRRMRNRVEKDRLIGDQAKRLEMILSQRFGDQVSRRHYWARYVPHEKVEAYEQLGWLWECVINEYAALMIWRCNCQCVEPK